MSAAKQAQQRLLGLFELDAPGTVIYARIEPDNSSSLLRPSVTGRNFYEEVAPFDNVEELRQRISQFRQGTSSAEHFNFDCRYSDGALLVRVLLTRLNERANDERAPSILVHIRKVA